ncbi:MAG: CoB--CoM heterodisulfide reductase iron-sulfur subunit A family protein [Deltaproteobacteria bacterium]|nr:CoB--CoM heterodisulfide reductase iron-sulfur subunit A family protein [Deltaproteobacteria bacterium]MBW1909382.1 CoB--CoM heterodisulfide reductase iron-sulfur subunit A family protein [Deltaproteobacteria bacterium]MBW2032766.1 CoB--CoM heterodisulfide reductase iron-sulfur subunit A family protein [Deltaproteobacteria bacterium]
MERRIGVYVCHCGLNIAATVDTKDVAEFAASLSGVVLARDYMFMCSDPGQELIVNDIKEHKLDRVVVAACSPLMHERTFRRVCLEAGVNPYLMEMANIREHCSWVHEDGATEKAKELVRAAVMKVSYDRPLETTEVAINPNTLIVGGGIAGIQAALDIANAGYRVYLVEREPSIGGHMIQLDKTFPTLDCSACILTPKMSEAGSHPNIELLSYSEVEEVSGSIGEFKVKIRKKARYVDEGKCTGCGLCMEACRLKGRIANEFDLGLGMRSAIYTPFAQAVPNKPVIDPEHCLMLTKGKCGKEGPTCVEACGPEAIDFEQKDTYLELEVGSIILTTGYDQQDPSAVPQYGYGRYDNVISGLEFERLSNASGPTEGQIMLKNGELPKSVAIIHCVGSRDKNFHEYCSRVCCMYALKFAHLIKEKTNAEVYQMYIDMRCFGEGYEEFYERLSTEDGIMFIRGKASKVTDRALTDEEKGKLIVCVEDTLLGNFIRVPVDMVILCDALEPRADSEEMAKVFSIGRRADGFFMERHVKLDPISTLNDGIFIAGCCEGPKDIPDTVAQAKAAASEVLSLLARGTVEIEPIVASVDEEVCVGCGLCEKMCVYGALSLAEPEGVMTVNEALCKGCGACSGICPSGAISVSHYTYRQILGEVEAFSSY